jgi:acylphosphatase
MDALTRRLTARVEGVVQGVGFRAFVAREARRLRVSGTVRNRPDGSVEVVAEGVPQSLRALEAALRRGPPGAVVRRVDATYSEARGEFTGFSIGY